MKLAASDNGKLTCYLCDWHLPFASWEEAEKLIHDHLDLYHRRLLVSYEEYRRKGRTERTWNGPRQF